MPVPTINPPQNPFTSNNNLTVGNQTMLNALVRLYNNTILNSFTGVIPLAPLTSGGTAGSLNIIAGVIQATGTIIPS